MMSHRSQAAHRRDGQVPITKRQYYRHFAWPAPTGVVPSTYGRDGSRFSQPIRRPVHERNHSLYGWAATKAIPLRYLTPSREIEVALASAQAQHE